MIPNTSSLPSASRKNEKNIWADYVELQCIVSPDKEISLNDLVESAHEDDLTDLERGSQSTAKNEDLFYQDFTDVFRYLYNRRDIFADSYPFTFAESNTLCVNTSNFSFSQKLYLFLLFASNLSCFSKAECAQLTQAFESLSKEILQCAFPQFVVEIFGTASKAGDVFYGGTVIERLRNLADSLHTNLTDSVLYNPRYQQGSGDAEIDIVGVSQLDKKIAATPFIPALFAQCTCSVDSWKSKQLSIKHDFIKQKFCDLSSYYEFVIVPFSLRGPDGQWSYTEKDRIVTIPIDRVRFLHIPSIYGNEWSFFERSDAFRLISESI